MQSIPPHILQAVAAQRIRDLQREAAASAQAAQARRARRSWASVLERPRRAARRGRRAGQGDGHTDGGAGDGGQPSRSFVSPAC